jgi:hypothetical protein
MAMFPKKKKKACTNSGSQAMIHCGIGTAKDHKDLKAHEL